LNSSAQNTGITRIVAIALACAGLYASVLGATATAQDATPESSPTAESSPFFTATPEETATEAPTQAPTEAATEAPTQTSTPGDPTQTPESSTPYPSPVKTIVSSSPTAAGTATGTPTPESLGVTAGSKGTKQKSRKRRKRKHVADEAQTVADCLAEVEEKSKKKQVEKVVTLESTTGASGGGLGDTAAEDTPGEEDEATAADCLVLATPAPDAESTEPERNGDGTPTPDNPTYAEAIPGAAPIGVPNFFIEKFRIPPFLLPIYQAAGIEYGVRWEVLAAINEIETDYGRNLNVSSAGALGWMQFMPATWKSYGVDANKDGVKDPYNPVDAIFAAARYLKAAGADTDLYKAIFAYNHADWYVESVLMRARLIGGLPSNFVGSLTGLTQARFPVHAKSTYAGDLSESERKGKAVKSGNAAFPVGSASGRRGIKIFARRGAPVIAVNDGKIVRVGKTERLGNYVQLQDVYGNTFTYAHLAKVAKTYPAPRAKRGAEKRHLAEVEEPETDAKPVAAASKTVRLSQLATRAASDAAAAAEAAAPTAEKAAKAEADLPAAMPVKERLFAHPARPAARDAGGETQLAEADFEPVEGAPLQLNRKDFEARPLKKGAKVIAGTVLGRIGATSDTLAPHVLFEVRPAGRGAPRIDPKPILDGWKLLESTAIYRAAGKNPFFGDDAAEPSIGQILLMSKEALQRRVVDNPRIKIYGCGRRDVRLGEIDRRVLATLEFLAASGLKPTVSSLKCGHGFYTASGNVSHHSSGNAVDIAAINGISIMGHQGKGSIADVTIQRLLTLQGTLKPTQIISLMTFEGADNTYAMGDHDDHIHIGWQPLFGTNSKAAKQVNAMLKPKQWIKLIDRLQEIENPTVATTPSKYAVKVVKKASDAHSGE
jgi:murein DD-endopeptidase MepM/ murein hydrolase activator NlpD